MNAMIAAYESRLRTGADQLDRMERAGKRDETYDRTLRGWLELLAAYEYEFEMAAAGAELAAAI